MWSDGRIGVLLFVFFKRDNSPSAEASPPCFSPYTPELLLVINVTLLMLIGGTVNIVRKDYFHETEQSKLNIVSDGRHFSLFLYSLITTVRILYPYASLPVFSTTEIGSKKIFQNKETSFTKTATKRSQCWEISKPPSWTESLTGKFQARTLLFHFFSSLFSHFCLPHAFSPPCIYNLLHQNAKFDKQFPVGT